MIWYSWTLFWPAWGARADPLRSTQEGRCFLQSRSNWSRISSLPYPCAGHVNDAKIPSSGKTWTLTTSLRLASLSDAPASTLSERANQWGEKLDIDGGVSRASDSICPCASVLPLGLACVNRNVHADGELDWFSKFFFSKQKNDEILFLIMKVMRWQELVFYSISWPKSLSLAFL